MPNPPTRREFIQQASLCATVAMTPLARVAAAAPAAPDWKIIAFSKPFTNLNFEQTADLVADVGWDGIECPVRKSSTHVVPERVEEDLPRMVEALRKRGRDVAMITTDITGVDRSAEQILRAAARAGIRKYRLGPVHYTADRPIPDQLADIKVRMRDVAQMNQSIGIQGGIQNHSGRDYFAAPVWDAVQVVQGLKPADLGIAFDIGHATLEGGLSWPIQSRLAEPYYTVVYVKDFRWEKSDRGWRSTWCPLGQGMVDRKFFATLAKSSFAGPIGQHHEYDLGKTPAEQIAHYKEDLRTLRAWLKEIA
jgi:sugar phosphate isomerase/epimerase